MTNLHKVDSSTYTLFDLENIPNTRESFKIQFSSMNTMNMNKTYATINLRDKENKSCLDKDRIWYLTFKNKIKINHANQIASYKTTSPEIFGNIYIN